MQKATSRDVITLHDVIERLSRESVAMVSSLTSCEGIHTPHCPSLFHLEQIDIAITILP